MGQTDNRLEESKSNSKSEATTDREPLISGATREAQVPERQQSIWRAKPVWWAFVAALLLRLAVVWTADYEIQSCCLEQGYLDGAATLASGKGLLMYTLDSRPSSAVPLMKELAAKGKRIDEDHPYPTDDRGWIPATLHPAGYSVFLWGLYEIGNYEGMVQIARFAAPILDALACFLIFIFARNLFGSRTGIISAWVYAILPAAVVLTLPYLPDSYARFFAALILALLSYARHGKLWALPAAGFAAGLAFHFRAEFLIWPFILWLCLMIDTRTFWRPTVWMVAGGAAMLVAMLPWTIWTYLETGRPMLSTTSAGGSMYESLGEIPDNPWQIVLDDGWVDNDARKRGFVSVWSVEADQFYRKLWKQNIQEHPDYFAKLIFTQRLPLALIPPYSYRRENSPEFDFTAIRDTEGLTKWGVVQKYPLEVIKYRGFEIAMAFVSLLLLLSMIAAVFIHRRNWRVMGWLIIPWLLTIVSMCLVKQIEARNVSSILVMQVVTVAIVLTALVETRRQRRRSGAGSVHLAHR